MLWNNIETKPYGFYPAGWDVNVLATLGQQEWEGERYGGKTVFEAAPEGERVAGWEAEGRDWTHPNIGEDEPTGSAGEVTYLPDKPHSLMWMFYLQRICNHCTYPACVAACPRNAIYKRPEDGVVLVDQTRCRGYQECVRACPYKKTMFNLATRVSEKCIGCYPKLEQGLQTQCTTQCIGRLRLTNYLSPPGKSDPRNPADFLVYERKVALPLYPQLGLEPNVYYIPPVHVPEEFTIQMFGPGVPQAIRTYLDAKDDPDLLGCLLLFGATERIMHSFEVKGDRAYAYDARGREIVSVPLTEPAVARPFEYKTQAAGVTVTGYRHNT
jgi:nitrate reductase beta subunit